MDSNKATPASPPEWFRLELYDFLGKLGPSGWIEVLQQRKRMRAALYHPDRDHPEMYYWFFLCTRSYNPACREPFWRKVDELRSDDEDPLDETPVEESAMQSDVIETSDPKTPLQYSERYPLKELPRPTYSYRARDP